MTDISSFIASGGEIKKGKTKKADGCEIHYSLPGGIPAAKAKPKTPSHMSRGDGRYWEK